jgi:hypothetical protein
MENLTFVKGNRDPEALPRSSASARPFSSKASAAASAHADGEAARRPTGALRHGIPEAMAAIAAAAGSTGIDPAEVWCAAGSGVLARGLAAAWPKARRHVVQVGRTLTAADVAGATIHVYPTPFAREAKSKPPFPSDPHYDAKTWELCAVRKGSGRVLCWNVACPASLEGIQLLERRIDEYMRNAGVGFGQVRTRAA